MKVAVTGGSGQLGTLVLRKLAANPSITSIVSLDVRPPSVALEKVHAATADVRDPEFACHLEGCDALVHLAFIVAEWATHDVMEAINVEGSRNVFRAAAATGVRQIVYTSSIAAYGVVPGHALPIDENTPRKRQAEFTYAANKFDVEAFLDGFEAEHPAIAVARLRPAILVGERVEHTLFRPLAAGFFPDLGDPPLPVVWDDDVAAAVALCLEKRAHGAFIVIADEPLDGAGVAAASGLRRVPIPRALVRSAAHLTPLLTRLGVKPPADPAWLEVEMPALTYSNAKAKRELGWAPKLATAADVFRRLGDTARRLPDPRIALFMRFAALRAKQQPPREGMANRVAAVHLDLTGPGGSDWTLRLDDGRFAIEPGVPRPPTSVITVRASVFRDLVSGRMAMATAELTGKIVLEGAPMGMMMVSGMVAMLQHAGHEPGVRGTIGKAFSRWVI